MQYRHTAVLAGLPVTRDLAALPINLHDVSLVLNWCIQINFGLSSKFAIVLNWTLASLYFLS